MKEKKNIGKFLNMASNLNNLLNMWVTVVPIVVVAPKTVSYRLKNPEGIDDQFKKSRASSPQERLSFEESLRYEENCSH